MVFPNRSKANAWIELRHTGENEGVGIIRWNGIAAARFRGDSPEVQFLEIVKDSDFLDRATRERLHTIAITNIQRIIGTPEARQQLGVAILNNQLVSQAPAQEVAGRLAIVASDIANKHFKVTHLDTKEQRVDYAKAVAKRSLPNPGAKISPTIVDKKISTGSSRSTRKRTPRASRTLIPKSVHLNIEHSRISDIFGEMQRLSVKQTPNSCAVLLRVFLEMSLNEFMLSANIKLKKSSRNRKGEVVVRNKYLKEKLIDVVNYLQKHNPECKNKLKWALTRANTNDTLLSIQDWNEYIHNQNYHPIPSELITIWKNIQPLFEEIWK